MMEYNRDESISNYNLTNQIINYMVIASGVSLSLIVSMGTSGILSKISIFATFISLFLSAFTLFKTVDVDGLHSCKKCDYESVKRLDDLRMKEIDTLIRITRDHMNVNEYKRTILC